MKTRQRDKMKGSKAVHRRGKTVVVSAGRFFQRSQALEGAKLRLRLARVKEIIQLALHISTAAKNYAAIANGNRNVVRTR